MQLTKKRHLTEQEERLLTELISRSSMYISSDWQEGLLVSNLSDGGMGSLILYPQEGTCEKRSFGYQVSDCQFRDIDGVVVIVSLHLDKEGRLYELDMRKTDFSPLKEIAMSFQDV